jgi:hypothetical protein
MTIDWDAVNGAAAWSALGLTGWQFWRDGRRLRREAVERQEDKLRVDVGRDSSQSLIVTLRFTPGTDHTVYGACLTVLAPKAGLLSCPVYESRSSSGIVMMPSLTWDPHAASAATLTADMGEYGAVGDRTLEVAVWAPGSLERAKLDVEIIDKANGSRVLKKVCAVTA